MHCISNKTHFNNLKAFLHSGTVESESFWNSEIASFKKLGKKTMICILKCSFELLKIVVQ